VGFARTSVCAADRAVRIDGADVKVLVVSGIWPPDVGGPASHAPDVAAFLLGGGHEVEVVTTADAPPEPRPYPVRAIPRHYRRGVRHYRGAALVRRRARENDVVYTTGMFGRSAAGSLAARRPYVVKLTADPAFERSRRTGLVEGDVDTFQSGGGGPAVTVLRAARDFELRHAAHVFCPSAYLRELAISWGVHPDRVSVLPNPAPDVPELRPREELKAELGVNGATIAFAGRLTAQKSLDRALEAVAAADGVSFVVAGEGPDREPLEAKARELGISGRVRFLGAQPRERVVELFRAADATILSSSWENFPHTVVEALAVGTPVLAMEAGGVAEVVHDGVNGLLVPAGDTDALASAVRRYFGDDALRKRLRARAAESVAGYSAERVFARLEDVLRAVA
jgi:glycosyltransferase involved in cell wall biosynthesis